MIKEIKIKGYDAKHSDIAADDGETAACYGYLWNENGSLIKKIHGDIEIETPLGYEVAFVHDVKPTPQLVLIRRGKKHDTLYDATSFLYDDIQLYEIGKIKHIKEVQICGDRVMISTDDGIWHLIWDGSSYSLLPSHPQGLVMEFGMTLEGSLTGGDVVNAPEECINSLTSSEGGSGASRRHPSSSTIRESSLMLAHAARDCWDRAVQTQVAAKGYFNSPLLLCYALHMHDGTIINRFGRIIMLPTRLPPCIDISTSPAADGSSVNINIGLSHNKYFSLNYRVRQLCDDVWLPHIASVDIFAAPLSTYKDSQWEDGYITKYRNVVASSSSLDVFDGIYSESGDLFVEHTVDEFTLSRMVWRVPCNTQLVTQLLSVSEFHMIASIPYSDLVIEDGFRPVPVITSEADNIDSCPSLPNSPQYKEIAEITALGKYGDTVLVAANGYRMAKPLALSAMTSFVGDASLPRSSPVEIAVYLRKNGKWHKSKVISEGNQLPLALSPPRYLYYPDANASLITMTQDSHTWRFPLTPLPNGDGAYWWGGFDTVCHVETTDADTIDDDLSDIVDTECTIYSISTLRPIVVTNAHKVGSGKILGLVPATRAPAAGDFGKFQLYAIASHGIWLLNVADGTVVSKQLISTKGCINKRSIAEASGKVAYAAADGIYLIDRSDTIPISRALQAMKFDISCLPHSSVLLSEAQAMTAEIDFDCLLNECSIVYDSKRNVLIVNGQISLVYNIDHGLWSVTDIDVTAPVPGAEGLFHSSKGHAVSIVDHPEGSPGMIVTRPIKIAHPITPRRISYLEVLGSMAHDKVSVALYGSDNLRQWHLVASSLTPRLYCDGSRPYRYFIAVIIGFLSSDDYIYGLQIDVADSVSCSNPPP